MNLPSPTYKPTCVTPPPGDAANSRMSPGCNASTTGVTSLPALACSRLIRGTRMPCWAYEYWISPEQSKPFSAVPPHWYGVPIALIAVRTTSAAAPVIAACGAGGGRQQPRRQLVTALSASPCAPPPPLPPPPKTERDAERYADAAAGMPRP